MYIFPVHKLKNHHGLWDMILIVLPVGFISFTDPTYQRVKDTWKNNVLLSIHFSEFVAHMGIYVSMNINEWGSIGYGMKDDFVRV